jgi:hypothetical protein
VSWAWRPRHCVKGLQADGVGAPKTQSMQASSKDLSGIGTSLGNTASQKTGEKKIAMDSSVRSQSKSSERHSWIAGSL